MEQVAAMKKDPMKHANSKLELRIDPEKTRDAISKMCQSASFREYAPHVLKGCAEFLSTNGTEFANVVKNSLEQQANGPKVSEKGVTGSWDKTVEKLCVSQAQVCLQSLDRGLPFITIDGHITLDSTP